MILPRHNWNVIFSFLGVASAGCHALLMVRISSLSPYYFWILKPIVIWKAFPGPQECFIALKWDPPLKDLHLRSASLGGFLDLCFFAYLAFTIAYGGSCLVFPGIDNRDRHKFPDLICTRGFVVCTYAIETLLRASRAWRWWYYESEIEIEYKPESDTDAELKVRQLTDGKSWKLTCSSAHI